MNDELKETITSQSNKLRVQETLTDIKFNIYSRICIDSSIDRDLLCEIPIFVKIR